MRDHFFRHDVPFLSFDAADRIATLLCRAVDVRRVHARATLEAFVERLMHEGRSVPLARYNHPGEPDWEGGELFNAFMSTVDLDPGSGESVWSFVRAHAKVSALEVAQAELAAARRHLSAMRARRDRARRLERSAEKHVDEALDRERACERKLENLECELVLGKRR